MTTRKALIKADSLLFSNLLREGRFSVPWHQRYYDWKPEDVQELLFDIEEALKEKRNYYFLGTVIFVEKESEHWEINDGQQRMITFSLICASLCRRFAHETSDSQREGRALRILFDLDENTPCSLTAARNYTPRISPQEDDAVWYRQMIRGNDIGTNGTITAAWKILDEFIMSQSTEESEKYFDFLVRKLEIARLRVPSQVDPNAVYETINCRGKRLDDLDLIRNHIYSHFNSEENYERKKSVHAHLERIRTRLSAKRASEYMRCHLQCVFGFLRRDSFYRDVRKAIRNQAQGEKRNQEDYVLELAEKVADPKSLCLFSEVIVSSNPDPKTIQAFNADSGKGNLRRNLSVLLWELRGYTVTQSLVFALLTVYLREMDGRRRKRIAKKVHKNLSRLAAFVLRTAFVAPKFEPSHFEARFSEFAKKIMQDEKIPDEEFAEFLLDCDRDYYKVLDDSKFEEELYEAQMTGDKKIKRFLFGINSDRQTGSQVFNDSEFSVEHILPKSDTHWDHWKGFGEEDPKEWVSRIGNLTLLGRTDNKPGTEFNGSFKKKKEIYAESTLAITSQLSQWNDWTPQNIKKRQRYMASRAVEVWRFIQ